MIAPLAPLAPAAPARHDAPPATRAVALRDRRVVSLAVSVLLVLTGALSAGVVTAPSANAASASAESGFISRINASRAAAGRPAYAVSADLTAVARAWAASMARSNNLRHNPRLASQVRGWRYVGENVGVGGTVSSLHAAFMGSPGHRANVLDRDFRQVGVGVVMSGGRMWVAEVFRKPTGSAAAAPVRATSSGVIGVGSRGAVVKRIQRKVGVRADGVYGPRTKAAVRTWQKRHNLRATGVVDRRTRAAMRV